MKYSEEIIMIFFFHLKIAARILESHTSFTKLGVIEAKMNFIRQWQSLPDYGVTRFNAKFRDSKKKQVCLRIKYIFIDTSQ